MLLYTISPMIIITTRIGNESILPAFFSALWLVLLTLYYKYKKTYLVVLCGLALGIGFYSFKGMRIIVPVWAGLTTLFILFINKINKKSIQNSIIFILTMLPFALIIPILELKYAGSIFDRSSIPIENYRYFIHYWLANMSPFSLFSEPDIGKIYQMDYFGALLISTLPLFIVGIYTAVRESRYYKFLLITFLLTPILFGVAKSTSYSHRLTGIVPLYIIITIFGIKYIYENIQLNKYKLQIIIFISIIITLNFVDFVRFYYLKYPNQNQTKIAFANNYHLAFKLLSETSTNKNLTPYIQSDIYNSHGDANKFYELAYFKQNLKIWKLGQPIPQNSIILTQLNSLENSTNLNQNLNDSNLNLLISNN